VAVRRQVLESTSYHEQPDGGLAFDLLSSATSGQRVVIGHANGVNSVDLAESTDPHRESVRVWLDEAYRTMLGHFRHEIGPYCWQVLIPGGPWEEPFRALCGDERASYSEALQRHHRRDPRSPAGPEFITPYASSHPGRTSPRSGRTTCTSPTRCRPRCSTRSSPTRAARSSRGGRSWTSTPTTSVS
jgi:hypothetical protein